MQISNLLQNKIDMSKLVLIKALTRTADNYANKQAHVELAVQIKKRDPGTAPALGDRVPYVMIKGAVGAKAYEKAEDPVYVLENNVPIDATWCTSRTTRSPIFRATHCRPHVPAPAALPAALSYHPTLPPPAGTSSTSSRSRSSVCSSRSSPTTCSPSSRARTRAKSRRRRRRWAGS